VAFGKTREFPARAGTNGRRKARIEGDPASGTRAGRLAAAAEKAREAVKVESLIFPLGTGFGIAQEASDLSEQGGKTAQIHLIVTEDARERVRGSSAKIVEIELRDEGGIDIVATIPAELPGIEDEVLEFD